MNSMRNTLTKSDLNGSSKLSKNVVTCAINRNKEHFKTYDKLPGPKCFPLIGSVTSLKNIGGDLKMIPYDKFIEDLHTKYGDLVKFSIFNSKNVSNLV